jgi:hypothetical protein
MRRPAGAGLWPGEAPPRRTPGHTGRTHRSKWLIRHTDRCGEQPSPALLIVQLAVTASMATPRAVACDRLRRTIDPAPTYKDLGGCLTRILVAALQGSWWLRGKRMRHEAGPFQEYESEDPPIG